MISLTLNVIRQFFVSYGVISVINVTEPKDRSSHCLITTKDQGSLNNSNARKPTINALLLSLLPARKICNLQQTQMF